MLGYAERLGRRNAVSGYARSIEAYRSLEYPHEEIGWIIADVAAQEDDETSRAGILPRLVARLHAPRSSTQGTPDPERESADSGDGHRAAGVT